MPDMSVTSDVSTVVGLLDKNEQESNDMFECIDVLGGHGGERRFNGSLTAGEAALSLYLGRSNCSDLMSECNGQHRYMLRGLCAITCGCGDIDRGIFNLEGCPSSCSERRTELAQRRAFETRLVDSEVVDLAETPAWRRFFHDLESFLNEDHTLQLVLNHLQDDNLTEAALREGCAFTAILNDFLQFSLCDYASSESRVRGSVAHFCPLTCNVEPERIRGSTETCGGSAVGTELEGQPCSFPFTYKGVVHWECTTSDTTYLWCYVNSFSALNRGTLTWAYCNCPND